MSRAWLLAPIAVAVAVGVAIVLSATGAQATENASSTVERLRQCRSGDTAATVVLVHGAWADASSWAGEVRLLQRAGVRVRAIANPVEDLTKRGTSRTSCRRSVGRSCSSGTRTEER
jgi:hypothetical protein